jgi:hypothetical protein
MLSCPPSFVNNTTEANISDTTNLIAVQLWPLLQGNYKNIVLATCSDSCPKDELLTNKDLNAEEILNGLMKNPAVYTKVERLDHAFNFVHMHYRVGRFLTKI